MRLPRASQIRASPHEWARRFKCQTVSVKHIESRARSAMSRSSVNAGEKMHRRAGAKMHHGAAKLSRMRLSGSIKEPAFPSRPGDCWRRRAA